TTCGAAGRAANVAQPSRLRSNQNRKPEACATLQPAPDRRSITLIVDPPATGLTKPTRDAVVALSPATLIYISCNPATLARDLSDLCHTFRLESVTPLDMFPQTAEIEVVAELHA